MPARACHCGMLPERSGFQGNGAKGWGEMRVLKPSSPGEPSQRLPEGWGPRPGGRLAWPRERGQARPGGGVGGDGGGQQHRTTRTRLPSDSQQHTLSATLSPPHPPRGGGGRRAGGQPDIPTATPQLIIFHDEHVIMSYTRHNQFGIATLMS